MQQSGGLLLPPVQTLVATLIFGKAENANESPAGHARKAKMQTSPLPTPTQKGRLFLRAVVGLEEGGLTERIAKIDNP